MAKMTDSELLALVEAEFSGAMGASDGEISDERARAWDFYLSKNLGNEVEGQSSVVTSDVADVVDGIMPSLLRIFTTADNLVDFEPVGAEDVPQAEQESDYVNYVFFKQNPAFLILYTWFFDALIQKNGIVKAWWDESEVVTTESYSGLTDEEVAELLDDDELEPVEREEREGTVIETLPPELGGQQIPVQGTVHDIMFRRTSSSGRVKVAPVPPEEYRISADSHSLDPSAARMVGQERELTRSELLEMGFDKKLIEDLPTHGDTHDSPEEISRRNKTDEDPDAPHDPSQEKILVKEAYIRVDFDGDGKSELREIIVAGNTVLLNEPTDRQPFHVISPQPLPHKHFGRATAEKVMDIQRVNTTLVRQILDNLYHTNNPSHAVWEQGIGENTLDDLLTTRVGSVRRFARPVGESYAPMTVPFTAAATFPMLEYWDKTKRDRTGISSDGEGLSPEVLKNIQTSVMAQANDLSRMKIEAIVRIFAETGIRSLFLHIHELLLKHQKKEEIVRLRNVWVPVNPQEWRTRQNVTVKIGLGIGTREQNLLHLNAIWEKQAVLASHPAGALLLSPKNVFNTAAEIVKNANLKTPEMFFTDPGDEPAPQPDDGQSQLAQAQIQLAQQQLQLEAQKNQINAERAQLQHQRDTQQLELQREAQSDKVMIELEKVATKLTELELEFQSNIPGSRV